MRWIVLWALSEAAFGQDVCRDLDAGRLKTGAFHYRTVMDGRDAGKSHVRRTVDEAVAANTIDQRIDWAAVMSFPRYEPDRECTFRVYDPGTGNSLVHVKIGRAERVQVPAGAFDVVLVTYRIDKNGGPEVYRLTMDRQSRFLVREQFPNGAVTELIEIEL